MSCDRSYGVELFASNEDDAVFWTKEPAGAAEDADSAGTDSSSTAPWERGRIAGPVPQLQTSGASRRATP